MSKKSCSKCKHSTGGNFPMCMNPRMMSGVDRATFGADGGEWRGEACEFARSLLMEPFGCRPWGRFFEAEDTTSIDSDAPRHDLWARTKLFIFDLIDRPRA